MSDSFWSHGLKPTRLLSPAKNTRVGNLSLLQGIFPSQGLNPGLQHCRQILYQLSHKGSPRILEWVAFPFSSRSSRPRIESERNAGRFFMNWAISEAHITRKPEKKKNPHKQTKNPVTCFITIFASSWWVWNWTPQCLCSLPILTRRGYSKRLWQELKHCCSKQHIIHAFTLTKIIRLAHWG